MESSTTIKNPNNNNHADNHNLINNQSQQATSLQNNNLTVSAQPFTPAANNNTGNNANNNNLAVQQSNNAIAPAQSYTPVPAGAAAPLHSVAATSAGHPIYNQAMHSPNMFVPAPGVHQAGPMYATMMPTQIPSNVYVNNVTANVNLHGWPHTVPTYIPAGAPHYIQGDVPPDQNPSVMQAIPGMPVQLAPSNALVAAGGNGNPSTQMGNMSGRGSRRGRGRGGSGGSRRGDYNSQRHPPPEGSPAPQQQMVQSQEQIGQSQSLTQQQQQSQQIDASNQLMAAGPPSYAAQPQYAHPPAYAAYPYQTYFTAQNPMLHPAQAAQQATGTPLYVSHMPMYNPVYNYMGNPFIYPPVMNPPEYQFLPGEDGQCDERQNPEGMVAPMWHPQPIYADEYGMNPELHNAGDEMNHNASSMGSVDTPSMLSPNYAMYDPQIHEVQQHMGMMHIYEDPQMAQMPGMHPEAPVTQLEEEIGECAAQPATIQMVSSGTMITAGPIQMSNETQIIHHSHAQHQSQHIIQNTVMEMKAHHLSESENVNIENSAVDDVSELQNVGSVTSLNDMHTHQSTENIVAEDYQSQQQLPLPQPQPQITQSQPKQQQQQQQAQQTSAHYNQQNAVDMPVAVVVAASEMYHNQHDNVPKEEPTEVPVATVAPAPAPVAVAAQSAAQQQQQQQQQPPTVAAVVSAQPASTAVASVSTATNVPTQQQQIQTSPPLQKYHHQQQQQQQPQQQHQQTHPKHQQQSYNRYDQQQQQQQQHHNQQYHHQQNHNYQYEQRRPQQNYNNNQSRRKYDYNNPSYAPNNNNNNNGNNNNNDSAIQTTKTMSWTNSSKKSTASVAVTATPSNTSNNNNNSNNQNRTYGHSSRTYTNHQHHYQQQSHYHQHNQQQQQQQQQHGGHYSQTPQLRNHGGMKVPSSPVGSNAPPQFGNNSASERRNSQAEQPKYANNANNSSYSNYNQYANNSGNNAANSSNANNAGASAATSTASITAAPQHFPQQQSQQQQQQQTQQQQHAQAAQQQQQHQQQIAAQVTPNQPPPQQQQQQQALVIDSKQYPGFTSSKKAAAATATATAAAAASTTPIMNLAPPVTANTNTTAPSTQSWASLFSDTNNANTTSASVSGAQSGNSNTNANTQSSNSSPALPPPFSSKKPIAKVAPYECAVPAPVNPTPSVVLPGAMSYSAASAQGIPPQAPSVAKAVVKPEPAAPTVRANLDEFTLKFADFLTKAKTDLSTVSLRPRGLTNPSNYCYINSILQALLGCAPFYNLIRSIPKQAAALSEVRTPTVNALISFVAQFSTLPSGMRLRTNKGPKGKDELGSELQCDSAFEPSDIYRLWVDSREEYVEGRQEDAEEFLSYVLNKLNDEMLEVIKLVAKPNAEQNGRNEVSESEDGGDEWQMICNNRNKGSVTRQQDFGRTPLSDIFRGELRSRLQREGEHSTDAIQPFFTLQLNIEKAASVKEALEILVGRDQLEGVTGSKTKQEVVAWQQMTLEKLPTILILHLKWFDYRSDGCTKILKKVEFPVDLKIDAKILASKKYSMKQRAYRLFAVVYHDGKEATKGHYITDVYHTGYSSWLRYNDSSVKPVSENEVLYPKTPRVPYLLYYRRCDTMPQQSNSATGGNANAHSNANHGGRDRDGK